MKRHRIRDELDDTSGVAQWEDSVGSDAQISLTCRTIRFQEFTNLVKDLLHDRILTKVVIPTFHLNYISLTLEIAFLSILPVA